MFSERAVTGPLAFEPVVGAPEELEEVPDEPPDGLPDEPDEAAPGEAEVLESTPTPVFSSTLAAAASTSPEAGVPAAASFSELVALLAPLAAWSLAVSTPFWTVGLFHVLVAADLICS